MRDARGPGTWPPGFLVVDDRVEEGLVVRSRSGAIEGRTTGGRLRCSSVDAETDCPGWFISVRWETGQLMRPCSEGWTYDPVSRTVRITGGGEIDARVINPVDPLPRDRWPERSALTGLGWRARA